MKLKIKLPVYFACVGFVFLVAGTKTNGQSLTNSANFATFANFESPQAHPIAISQNAKQLYAVNTPGYSLSVYSLADPASPKLIQEIPVGVEPVSVTQYSANEIWVVNHISDSISVVDLSMGAVVETIHVGDRPGDIVFAGSPKRAFITSMTERNVSVIDPKTRKIIKTILIPGNDPRTLLASSDGQAVWVAISRSGNQTTIVPHTIAPPPPKPANNQLPPAPAQGIIVKYDDPKWKDRLGVNLPDKDVFEIDATKLALRNSYRGVGTILFNLAQNPNTPDAPDTHELWVANTDARNLVRFEPQLKGHAIDSRVTRIETGSKPTVLAIDLNPDIDYKKLPNRKALATAISQPTDIVFDRAGQMAYVASFGTDRIGILDKTGKLIARIDVGDNPGADTESRTKRGPRAIAVHPTRDLIYVLNRLSNSISIIDTAQRKVLAESSMFDPTPKVIRQGRGYLFDAKLSGNGTASCASCHIDGDRDDLAWDLGDPGGNMFGIASSPVHPMKGPLLTQTLRGLAGERIFHWRADRPGLESFNGAFEALLGGERLNDDDMDLFAKYLKSIRFAANPNRLLDNTLPTKLTKPNGPSAKDGQTIFLTQKDIGRQGTNTFRCADCHSKPSGAGSFGFTGLIDQPTKAAQLRGLNERTVRDAASNERVSGFGFGPDGSKDSLIAFLDKSHRFGALKAQEKESLRRFLLAFPTETLPIVGFTRTVTKSNANTDRVKTDLQMLIAQAERGRCDLLVHGVVNNRKVGFVYEPTQKGFKPNPSSGKPEKRLALAQLIQLLDTHSSVITFIGLPPGTEIRTGKTPHR